MSCHSRQHSQASQAPMVSVTHFMDRDGNFLAEISPRRYFCNQCHVPQLDAKPLVENTFIDMHSLMKRKTSNNDSTKH
jgi:cytochrome c-type protein NapB